MTTRADLNAELARLVGEAEASLTLAENFAIEHKLRFDFSPGYGMGGEFKGEFSEEDASYYGRDAGSSGWIASSETC